MYKTRNTGTWNGMRGTRGMGGMLYSEECRQAFRECPQTFQGMSSNIPGNLTKYFWECRKTFPGMSPNNPGNVLKYSGEYRQTFRGMSSNISGNVTKYSGESPQISRGMSPNIPRHLAKLLSLVSECFTVHEILTSSNESE